MMNPLIEYTKWLVKWIAIIIGALVGLVVVVALAIGGWEWWFVNRHKEKLYVYAAGPGAQLPALLPDASGVIDLSKSGRPNPCVEHSHPVAVGFVNNSQLIVEHIVIDVEATFPGHSTNILKWPHAATMDRIVEPGRGYVTCWFFLVNDSYKSHPLLLAAVYNAHLGSVRFKSK